MSRPLSPALRSFLSAAFVAAALPFVAVRASAQAGAAAPASPDAIGATEVLKWHGGAKACFLLMFDDGWPSHVDVAVPELEKRGLVATYYIVPEKGEFKAREKAWREELWKRGAIYGNHTLTHHGVKDFEDARREIGQCTEWILDTVPGKRPRLVSYAQPGVEKGKWNITGEEQRRILEEFHLVDRPDFRGHGAVYHLKTCDDMLALADKAIAEGGMEYVIFHGVEHIAPWRTWQDFWAMQQDIVFPFFDAIAERRDRGDLWVTDHISYHKYATERASARVKTLSATPQEIRLSIQCDADPQFYDQPLTLRTRVPNDWTGTVMVTHGHETGSVPIDPATHTITFSTRPFRISITIVPDHKEP